MASQSDLCCSLGLELIKAAVLSFCTNKSCGWLCKRQAFGAVYWNYSYFKTCLALRYHSLGSNYILCNALGCA